MKCRFTLATAVVTLAMWIVPATGSHASELIFAQTNDGQSTYGPSQMWSEPLTVGGGVSIE